MCMLYLNTNVQCFENVTKNILGKTSFSAILDSVKAKEKNGKFEVSGFNIVTFINVRGTKDVNQDNALNKKKTLCFRIRLTKLDNDEEKQLSYDLRDFEIDLSDDNLLRQACFPYAERIEITDVDNLLINEKGSYVIKVLVKEKEESLYNVQMVHPLYIE